MFFCPHLFEDALFISSESIASLPSALFSNFGLAHVPTVKHRGVLSFGKQGFLSLNHVCNVLDTLIIKECLMIVLILCKKNKGLTP